MAACASLGRMSWISRSAHEVSPIKASPLSRPASLEASHCRTLSSSCIPRPSLAFSKTAIPSLQPHYEPHLKSILESSLPLPTSRLHRDREHGRQQSSSSQTEDDDSSTRQRRLFLYLVSAAPAVFFRANSSSDSDDDSSPLPPLAPSDNKRFRFTGAGGLMLGLGTLGVNLTAMRMKSATRQEQLPFKRKLFQNLQEMFNLSPDPASTESDHKEADAPTQKTETDRHVFERLVKGDKLVLGEGDITKDQWNALSSFLASCPHITSLRLQGIEISAEDADKLGKGLQQLRHLTFCDNSIGIHEGSLERLVALLLCCGLLESTSIIRNSLDDQHIPQLVKLIKDHTTLTRVSFCWNGISDKGATQMASAIAVLNTSLQDMDLSYNLIGSEGKSHLLDASRHRVSSFGTSLRSPLNIHLRHNERFLDFKREYRAISGEFLSGVEIAPWYMRRAVNKENFYPKYKRTKKIPGD